jgi:altronate hydrolase
VKEQGLVFVDTPGDDSVFVTGMVAGGANLVCFTTGRDSVFDSKPAPNLKFATNSTMYHNMVEDMDINCGQIADGQSSLQQMREWIFHSILETASGFKTKSEILGMGIHEFVPWHIGPEL